MDICDFHSHILPGADHGSSSLEVTLGQLELAGKYGVTRIVSTSHFYPQKESVESFIKRRTRCYNTLFPSLAEKNISVTLGAEVLICDNIENLPSVEKLCIGNSNIILLELPFNDFSTSYCESVSSLIDDGYFILLAHADRYEQKNIETLLRLGAKIQLNVNSLDKLFKTKHLYDWMERGYVYALGSDIHKVDPKAYKHFKNAKEKVGKYLPYIKEKSDEMWNMCVSK